MSQYLVLLYSNYSSSSKKIINIINEHNLNENFNMICVDNKEFRKRLKKSKTIKVNAVPCILLVYIDNGGVEKYDGLSAFTLVNNMVYNKQQEEKEIQPEPKIKKVIEDKQTKQTKQTKRKEPIKQSINEEINLRGTSILDLISDDEEDEEVIKTIKRPKKSIRTDAGNYELGLDFGDYKIPDNPKNVRGIKSNNDTNQKSDILSQAQQMQKLRELEDSKTSSEQPLFN